MLERFERFVFEKMKKHRMPSVAVSVVKEGELIYSKAWGFSDLERKLKATPKTVYGIGSISKSFACLAVLKLAEEGKLSLNDPVEKYVPLKLDGVKIHHLMSHTSGIPGLGYAEESIRQQIFGGDNFLPVADIDDLVMFMKGISEWYLFKPGERWFYLNEGYEILERTVEVVSGKSYKDFLREEIFKPLGLSCRFLDEPSEDFAAPYYVKGNEIRRAPSLGGPMNGAGGIACSSEELAMYGYSFVSRKSVVSEEALSDMESPKVEIPIEIPFGRYGYGYGLMVMGDFFGRKLVGHGGSVLVYTAQMFYSREEDISIAILSNSSGYSVKNLALYALSEIFGEDPEELPFAKTEKVFEKLTGEYHSYMSTIRAKVVRSADFLKMILKEDFEEMEVILVPEVLSEDSARFYTLMGGSKIPVEFFKKDGKVLMIYERYVLEKV